MIIDMFIFLIGMLAAFLFPYFVIKSIKETNNKAFIWGACICSCIIVTIIMSHFRTILNII